MRGLGLLLAWIGIGLLSPVIALGQSESQHAGVVVGPDMMIFGNPAALKLVEEARKVDPLYCPSGEGDRDKAARLYEQAIEAQPGAKSNAALANRIAQMCASYEDPPRKVYPDQNKARQWWGRCLEYSNPRQLLWAQAQMGLGCAGSILGDREAAAAAFDSILKLDMRQMELDDWRALPRDDSKFSKAELEKERERLERLMKEAQASAGNYKADVLKAVEVIAKATEPRPPQAAESFGPGPREYAAVFTAAGLGVLILVLTISRIRKRQRHV